MRLFFICTAVLISVFSCQEAPQEVAPDIEFIPAEIPELDKFPYDSLPGLYYGDFGGSPIRISLNYVSSSNAIGYNLHKGLQRNISGSVLRNGDSIRLVLSEPGDNKYDGVFTIDFIGENDKTPKGKWVANNSHISEKEFSLKKIEHKTSESYDEVTITNFARIFRDMSDSIGQYHFSDDGFVSLKYYPGGEADWDNQQYKELQGAWDLNGEQVIINWEPNDIFEGNKLVLTIDAQEHGEFSLLGEGDHVLWMMWY